MMWKGANIEVVDLDLGTNVTAEAFVAAAREHGASLVGVSRPADHDDGRHEGRGGRRPGGRPPRRQGHRRRGPVTAEFAASIGADGYAPDAASAVEVAKTAVGMA